MGVQSKDEERENGSVISHGGYQWRLRRRRENCFFPAPTSSSCENGEERNGEFCWGGWIRRIYKTEMGDNCRESNIKL